jgi:hypothetical protein
VITGPTAATTIGSLHIGSPAGMTAYTPTFNLAGGNLTVAGPTTVEADGILTTGVAGSGGFATVDLTLNGRIIVGPGTTATVAGAANVMGGNLAVNGNLIAANVTAAGTVNLAAGASNVTALNVAAGGTLLATAGTIGALGVNGGTATLRGAAVTTGNFSGGTATMSSGSLATANVSDGGNLQRTGGTLTTLNVSGGVASISGAATANTTLNLSGGQTTLSTTVGTVNFADAGATLLIGGASAGATTVSASAGTLNTQGNPFSVSGQLTSGNVVMKTSGTAFQLQSVQSGGVYTNVLDNAAERTLGLSGGTITLTQVGLDPGLDVRAWAGTIGIPIEGLMFDPVNPSPAPTDSVARGTIGYMTASIHTQDNGVAAEWFQKGGSVSGTATGYVYDFAVEYRGKLFLPAGTYRFATTGDDGNALWIDPSSANPAYADANIQSNYPQSMVQRVSNQMAFTTAGYHDFIVRFNQGGGGAALYVQYDPTGGTNFVDVPGNLFYHTANGPVGLPNTHVKVMASSILDLGESTEAHVLGDLNFTGSANLTLQNARSVSFRNVVGTRTTTVQRSGATAIPIMVRGSLTPNGALASPVATMNFYNGDVTLAATTGSALFCVGAAGTNDHVDLHGNRLILGDLGLGLAAGNLNVLYLPGVSAGTFHLFTNAAALYKGEFANTSAPPPAPAGLQWYDYSAAPGVQWISYVTNGIDVQLVPYIPPHGNGTWTNAAGNGNWSSDGNWTPLRPAAAGEIATFDGTLPNAGTVTIDSAARPLVVGGLAFNNATPYTIGAIGGYSLTLDGGVDGNQNPLPGTMTVLAGSHTVAAPLVLAGDLSLSPAAGTTLVLTDISESPAGSGKSLTLNDGGTVVLTRAAAYTGLTRVLAGELRVADPAVFGPGNDIWIGAGGRVSLAIDLNTAASRASAVHVAPLSVTAVPEPGALALLAAATVALLAFAARRR